MTGGVRRGRELSISDYGFMVHAESVFTDRDGYRYLMLTPSSRSAQARGRFVDDAVSDVTRHFVACTLALLVGGMFAAAIWFVYFAPMLALPAAP